MKAVIQRVSHAIATVNDLVVGAIGTGLLVLIGFTHDDTHEKSDALISKIVNLRIFSDENGKMNLSVQQANGGILIVSQFTLYGDCSSGNRPSFTSAMAPEKAKDFYDEFVRRLEAAHTYVDTGQFGGDMKITMLNDGPVTIILER